MYFKLHLCSENFVVKNVHMSGVGGSGGTQVVATVRRKRDQREVEEKVDPYHIVVACLNAEF